MVVCLPPHVSAQLHASTSTPNIQDPNALVREVIHNEMQAQLSDQSLWCYREQRQEESKPAKTLQVCQTKDGELERLVALDGRELTSLQAQAEDDRIQRVVSHPEQLRAKQKRSAKTASKRAIY